MINHATPRKEWKKDNLPREELLDTVDLDGNLDFIITDVHTSRRPVRKEPLSSPITYEELIAAKIEEPFCQEVLQRRLSHKRKSSF